MTSFLDNIDFNNLKYNLYELLNIDKNSNYKKIKKAYKRLIIQFHPDKSSELEEEIFHNITLAYQILKNDNLRFKYDNWLLNKNTYKDQYELKNSFSSDKKDIDTYFLRQSQDNNNNFDNKVKNKELYHGLHNYKDFSVVNNFNNNNKIRKTSDKIKKQKFNNTEDFNNNFKLKKSGSRVLKADNKDLICYKTSEIKKYFSTKDYNKLYESGTIQNELYTSLDIAFLLHPEMFYKKNIDTKEKIKKYKKQTKKLNVLKFNLND